MQRDPRLRKLSSDHHHALVLARRLTTLAGEPRAQGEAREATEARETLALAFERELAPHFRVEEDLLLPAFHAAGLSDLAERTQADHDRLRALAAAADAGEASAVAAFAALLVDHVRFEERELFPACEAHLSADVLDAVERRGHVTPAALEALSRALGEPLEVRDVPATELRWDEVPPDACVQAVLRPDGRRVAFVHARRGRFSATRVFGPRPGPVPLLGVVADALVFGDPADDTLRALTHVTSVKDPRLLEAEYIEPLAGRPRAYAGRVVEWGPFPHAVPTRAVDELARLAPGHTVILESLDARADGPRTTLVVHPQLPSPSTTASSPRSTPSWP